MKKAKNNKKKTFIAIVCLILIIILILAFILIKKDNKLENLSHKDIVNNVVNSIFLNSNTTLEKIEEYTVSPVSSLFVSLGKDSYSRLMPTSTLNLTAYAKIQQKNVDIIDGRFLKETSYTAYEKIQQEYADIVEKKYLNGTSYTITELEDGNLFFEIKPWYYATYTSDVSLLASKLIELENIDENLLEDDIDEYSNYLYKAQVKAMVIINDYLNYYENKDENKSFVFLFEEDEPDENQYLSLYFNLVGVTSDYMVNSEEKQEEQEERVEGYLEKSIENGTVDENNPLEL